MALNNFDEFIDKTDYLQTRLLQVNSCGSGRVVKYDYTILRSNGRRDFHFLYLQNGWLDIEVGTAKARLTRGQCAVFLPNVRQMYSFTAAGDPVSLYLHFTGQAAAEAMQYLRPTENMIYTISDQTLFESLFHRLNRLHNLQQSAALQIPEENSILLQLITIVCRSSADNEAPIRSDILSAMEYMREHMPTSRPLPKRCTSATAALRICSRRLSVSRRSSICCASGLTAHGASCAIPP